MRVIGWIVGLVVGTLVAACTQLPVDGPHHRDITTNASASLISDRHEVVLDYALVDINKSVLEYAVDVGPGSFFRTFGAASGPAPIIRVGVGDVVQVSVFEFVGRRVVHPRRSGRASRQLRNNPTSAG